MDDKLKQMQESYDKYKSLKNEVPLAVSVIVLNSDNKVIGVSRKDDHNDFGLPGGKVDPEDKDTLDATIRELYEETGLLFEREKFIKIYQGNHMEYWQTTYYVNVVSDMDDSVFNYDEPHVVKWVDWQTVFDGSFGKYNRIVYKKLEELLTCMK
jgi:8-oxo-dGTP pyrophosphatase MutT (NUDIX family)